MGSDVFSRTRSYDRGFSLSDATVVGPPRNGGSGIHGAETPFFSPQYQSRDRPFTSLIRSLFGEARIPPDMCTHSIPQGRDSPIPGRNRMVTSGRTHGATFGHMMLVDTYAPMYSRHGRGENGCEAVAIPTHTTPRAIGSPASDSGRIGRRSRWCTPNITSSHMTHPGTVSHTHLRPPGGGERSMVQ